MNNKGKIGFIMTVLTVLLAVFGMTLRSVTENQRMSNRELSSKKLFGGSQSKSTVKYKSKTNKKEKDEKIYPYFIVSKVQQQKVDSTILPAETQQVFFESGLGTFEKTLVTNGQTISIGTPLFSYQVKKDRQNEIDQQNEILEQGIQQAVQIESKIDIYQKQMAAAGDDPDKVAEINELRQQKIVIQEKNAQIISQISKLEKNQVVTQTVDSSINGTVNEVGEGFVRIIVSDEKLQFVLSKGLYQNYHINDTVTLQYNGQAQAHGKIIQKIDGSNAIVVIPDQKIEQNMKVQLLLPQKTVELPSAAIDKRKKQSVVFIVDKQNKLRLKRVYIYQTNQNQVTVDGLKVGQRILLSPGKNLQDGDVVSLEKVGKEH